MTIETLKRLVVSRDAVERFLKSLLILPYNYVLSLIGKHVMWTQWNTLLSLKFRINPLLNHQCSYYGLGKIAKKYGINNLFRCCIEHGVIFSYEDDTLRKRMQPKNMWMPILDYCVFSKKDKESMTQILNNPRYSRKARVHSIGPYILLADHFCSKRKLKKLKQKFGRVLLVFPMHSTEFFDCKIDADLLINKTEEIKKDFDTILICFYWHDLILGREKNYHERNYKVVCCGRREDPFFLSRQKDLFYLADMTLTNGPGTHVGYSIAMGVPCCILKHDFEMHPRKGHIENNPSAVFMQEGFYKVFTNYSFEITSEQKELVKKWWGDF